MLERTAVALLGSTTIFPQKTVAPCGRHGRRTHGARRRGSFRPELGLLEDRTLLSADPTLTALTASTVSALSGESVTFTATVSDLTAGGAVPNDGTVAFSDQNGAIGSATLVSGEAMFTTSSLPAGTNTITASYSGTTSYAASSTGTIVTAAGDGTPGTPATMGPQLTQNWMLLKVWPSTPPAMCLLPTTRTMSSAR